MAPQLGYGGGHSLWWPWTVYGGRSLSGYQFSSPFFIFQMVLTLDSLELHDKSLILAFVNHLPSFIISLTSFIHILEILKEEEAETEQSSKDSGR